jgi:membrane protease YdiL (CAAX protease family)
VPWGLGRTGKGLAGGLLLALFTPLIVLPFDPDFDSDGALLAAQALLGGSLLFVAVGMASDWEIDSIRGALRRLGLRRFAPSALGWMLLAMLAYYIAAGVFAAFVLEPEQDDIGGELGVGDDSLVVAVLAVVLIVGLAPISEELFFRGFVFPGLRSRFSLWPAALLAGLVFGLIHAPTGITTVVPLTALGVVLCWLYDRTGSLWPCVLAHTLNNGLALAIVS